MRSKSYPKIKRQRWGYPNMYASRSDITEKYGASALYPAVDADGGVDDAKVTKALKAASAKVDSYLGRRHVLPLPSTPDILVAYCVDIAVYEMSNTADTLTEIIEKRYKDAVMWLKDISAGRASLGLPAPAGKTSARPVVTTGSPKMFSRKNMRDL